MWSAFGGLPLKGGGMRREGGLGVEKMLFLVVVLFSSASMAAEPSDLVKAVCPNALKMNDPDCQNDGTLRALNNTDYLNCAFCNCPKEWKGAECNLCTDPKPCPEETMMDGKKVKAVSCTNNRIDPTDYEFSNGVGKELSCFCGGSDTTSDFVCQKLPGTNLKIKINPPKSNETTVFSMSVLQRAGTPSQDYMPPCKPGEKNCATKKRYSYAYPQVWQGDFESCKWKIGDCLDPMEGKDCVNYKCDKPKIECPPPGVQKCPGWTYLSCANPENENRPYWSHHCNPLAVPFDGVPIQISCKPQLIPGKGSFQCYMMQPALPIASLGLQCYTGTCVYPHLHPDSHQRHKNKGSAFRKWIRKKGISTVFH